MAVVPDDLPISEIERKACFPNVDEASDYLMLSSLANEVKSLQYKDVFHNADTKGPIVPHFYEKNSKGGKAMIITSESLKYVCIVFGCPENAEYWDEHKRIPMSRWGPEKGLPFGEDVKINSTTNDNTFLDDLSKKLYNDFNVVIKDHPKYKVVVCGHGQGGAMSTVFATYLAHKKPVMNIHNITYGSPRVGGDAWKTWVQSLKNLIMWRFVLNSDCIASIPAMTMGYRHVGHLMHLDSKQSTKAYYDHPSEENNEDSALFSKPPEFLTVHSKITEPVKDHCVEEYLNFLKGSAAKNPKESYARTFETIETHETEMDMSVMDKILSFCA